MAIRQRYHDAENLLSIFNPDNQIKFTLDIHRAYRGAAPSLCAIKEAFGGGTSRSWLVIQLNNLSEFAGCKDKLSIVKLEELANIIMSEYAFLKLTELMDFFKKLKNGEYGKFYGSVDPMVITCALKDFMRERAAILARLDQAEKDRNKWQDPDYVNFRRKAASHKAKRIFYSRNFYAPDFSYEEFSEIWWLFNLGYESNNHGYITN